MIDHIQTADLVYLYKKNFDVDITSLIQGEVIKYHQCKDCDLFFFDPVITGDEKFYQDFQKFDWYYLNEKKEYHFAKKFVTSTDHVLEIGSGSGFFHDFISPKKYVGLEFNNAAIDQASKRGLNVVNETIEAHAIKFLKTYDVVCNFQVLEHVADINGFISSAIKCLKPDGLLIIAVPNHDSFLRYCYNNILNLPPHHISHWSIKALTKLTELHDIELVDIFQESVDAIHERWFVHTLIYKILISRLKYPAHLIDLSLTAKILSKFSSLIRFFINEPLPLQLLPVGHTVCVVYKKK